jgi:hypothetical protein
MPAAVDFSASVRCTHIALECISTQAAAAATERALSSVQQLLPLADQFYHRAGMHCCNAHTHTVRLLDIGDTVGMASEIARTVAAVYCCSLPQTVMIALASRGIVPVDTRIHLGAVACSFFILYDVNVMSRHAWGRQNTRKLVRYKTVAVISSTQSDSLRLTSSQSMRCVTGAPVDPAKLNTSLQLLKSEPLKAAYANYVEKALCYESYKFLVDAAEYSATVFEVPAEQVS